jgi:glycosyltransferase involved in cell wall biosynthesis
MISIITATFNSEKTIEETLNSVLNLLYNDFEYIIVDGQSTDRTLKIVEGFRSRFEEKKIPLTLINEKDEGIYDAWNKGIKTSKGEWIGFLGSDDRYYKNALKQYSEIISRYSDLDYISSKVRLVDCDNKTLKVISGQWNWNVFKKYMSVAHVGSLHSSQYFKKYGNFNINYKIAGDYEMLLRAKENLKYKFLDQITVDMDHGGVSNNLIYKTLQETKQAKISTGELNKFTATLYFYWALVKAKIKQRIK